MNTVSITRSRIMLGIIAWYCLIAVLALSSWNPLWLATIVATPFVLFVPGSLALVWLGLMHLEPWTRATLTVGISTLTLMVGGFVVNDVLPRMGVNRPLDAPGAVFVLGIVTFTFLTLAWHRLAPLTFVMPCFGCAATKRDLALIGIPFAFLVLSIAGAMRLNNGASGILTMAMLIFMGVYVGYVLKRVELLGRATLPAALFFLSLSLLMMTSLRGWHIAGHDIQREFYVFQLAADAGHWSMDTYRDAYNACLSITILPTLYKHLTQIPDAYLYKALYQVIFAFAGVLSYLIARKWLTARFAFLSGLLFISLPTFFQDMPYLIRQEVAFLFLGLLFLILFEESVLLGTRRALATSFGIGVVLSHYATTYSVMAILALTTIITPLALRIIPHLRTVRLCRNSVLGSPVSGTPIPERKLTFRMVAVIIGAGLLWTFVITDTGGHTEAVAQSMWDAVRTGIGGDSRSADVLVFFTFGRVETNISLDDYVRDVVLKRRAESPDTYYATSTYASIAMPTVPVYERPWTRLGSTVLVGGITVGEAAVFFGSLAAKAVQAAVLIGLAYVLFGRWWLRRLDIEFYVLASASAVFVALTIVLPVLSKEYGVFRALQEAMFVLAPFAVIGTLLISFSIVRIAGLLSAHLRGSGEDSNAYAATVYLAGTFGMVFFLYATGLVAQVVGGNIPAVYLNTQGDDYAHYITEDGEYEAIMWLRDRLASDTAASASSTTPLVQADRFGQKKLQAYLRSRTSGDIYPGLIERDAYVFLGPAVLRGGTATLSYNGAFIKYRYPVAFVEAEKDLVYDNGSVRIYR